MKLILVNSILACSLLISFICRGELTDVYCATIDGNSWDWLYDENGDYARIDGEWGFHLQQENKGFGYLSVSFDDYKSVQSQCEAKGMVAHPGDNRYSSWYVFQVKMPSGHSAFTQGVYSVLVSNDFHL